MPSARCRLPGPVYMVQRRTERRVHLFRPDAVIQQVFLYCLGVALQATGVRLVAATLMSNHYHIVVIDPEARVCELMERLNLLLTKTTQAARGWQGSVFDASGPSYTELLTPEAMIDKTAYALANPTAAGLVRYSKEWPGVRTRVADLGGRTIVVERPEVFFAADGAMPERVEIELVLPEVVVEAYGVEGARSRIADAVEAKERAVRAEVEAAGRSFKGADRVLKSSPYSRAKTFEERHRLNPRYAGDRAAIDAAAARDAEFVKRYSVSRERWLAGERDVMWPAGTYAMKRWHHVRCAEPPG